MSGESEDNDPVIHVSGGLGPVYELEPGVYVTDEDVYIGSWVRLYINNANVKSVFWQGGTNYRSYFANDEVGLNTSVASMEVLTGVNQQTWVYEFIADANPRSYGISVDVTYSDDTSGHSTLSFTTIRPAASISGTGGGVSMYETATVIALAYDNLPFEATATTPPSPSGMNTSMYMIMQLADVQRSRTSFPGFVNSERKDPANDGIAWHLDDSGDQTIGYRLSSSAYSWDDSGISPKTQTVMDEPYQEVNMNSFAELHINNEQFRTFLMFKPSGGMWIALGQVQWAWSGALIDGPSFWKGSGSATSATMTSPLTGGQEFPNWSGRGSQTVWT